MNQYSTPDLGASTVAHLYPVPFTVEARRKVAQPLGKPDANFYQVHNDFIKCLGPVVGANGIAIYNVLVSHKAAETGEAWPGIKRIAYQCGITEPTVTRYLRLLEVVGVIEIAHAFDPKSGAQLPNDYQLLARSSWVLENEAQIKALLKAGFVPPKKVLSPPAKYVSSPSEIALPKQDKAIEKKVSKTQSPKSEGAVPDVDKKFDEDELSPLALELIRKDVNRPVAIKIAKERPEEARQVLDYCASRPTLGPGFIYAACYDTSKMKEREKPAPPKVAPPVDEDVVAERERRMGADIAECLARMKPEVRKSLEIGMSSFSVQEKFAHIQASIEWFEMMKERQKCRAH